MLYEMLSDQLGDVTEVIYQSRRLILLGEIGLSTLECRARRLKELSSIFAREQKQEGGRVEQELTRIIHFE